MSGFMFFVLKYVTGPRPLNSSPTPPVYAWSVSQDLVDRTLSGKVMMLVHLKIVLLLSF